MALSKEYIAGLFDGEGSVGLYRDKRTVGVYKPSLRIELRDEVGTVRLLGDLCEEYGVKLSRSKRGTCVFSVYREEALKAFIGDILPFTRLKTAQLVLLDAWLETKTFGYRFHQLLKNHKQRRIK